MEKVCPMCNAMETPITRCPECGACLTDRGPLGDYLGPYSPYMDSDLQPFMTQNYCTHLFSCPRCQEDIRVAFQLVFI